MIIDEECLKDGLTPSVIEKLIERHRGERDRYNKLMNYYLGEHKITEREKASKATSNNKLICNHAKYIVDMTKSYLIGNPVTYSVTEEYNIDAIKNSYLVQDMATIDGALEKQMSIYGKSFELVYIDEEAEPKSVCLSPVNTFVVYSSSVDRHPILGVHYFKKFDINKNPSGVECIVCDNDYIYTFENKTDSFKDMSLIACQRHYFEDIPLIEYRNNEEEQGDFEQLIPLIDAYNILTSDRVNDKEQFVDAFLFLTGVELSDEQAKKLKEERILMGYEGASAQYLSKVMCEQDIQVLSDSLRRDIHRFSMVPDLSDEQFGNNLSGVAIKYKLMGFEQQVRNKERYFTKALKKRFLLYTNYYSLKGSMEKVPIHKVDIQFTRNMPVNELEISQMIQNLSGIATKETLLSQLSFVSDAKEEASLLREEQRLEDKSGAALSIN